MKYLLQVILMIGFLNTVYGQTDSTFNMPFCEKRFYPEVNEEYEIVGDSISGICVIISDVSIDTIKYKNNRVVSNMNYKIMYGKAYPRYYREYAEGELNGLSIDYSNNIPIAIGYNKNGLKDSLWTYYYSNGNTESHGYYIADSLHIISDFIITSTEEDPVTFEIQQKIVSGDSSPRHGVWYYYDLDGNITNRMVFEYGVLKEVDVGNKYYRKNNNNR